MASINIYYLIISFAAGFLTFFAGCIAPIAPVYVAFLAGSGEKNKNKKVFLTNSLLFTLGFILVFLLFGFGVSALSVQLAYYRYQFQKLIGVIVILLGLFLLDLWHFNFTPKQLVNKNQAGTKMGALLLGISMSFAWTPCIGPVLATILLWISTGSNIYSSSIYLIFFSVGLALPFLLIGLAFERIYPQIKNINKYSKHIKTAAAVILVLFGLLMLTNYYAVFTSFFLQKLGSGAFVLNF